MEGCQWAIKPFSKHFTPASVGVASEDTFDLLDTDGNSIDCNYVSIKPTAGSLASPGGYIFVRPLVGYETEISFAELYGDSDIANQGANPDGTGPGLGGVIRYFTNDVKNEPIIIRTSGTEMFNQVTINSITAGFPSYEITYGVIYPVNSLETLKIPTRGQ